MRLGDLDALKLELNRLKALGGNKYYMKAVDDCLHDFFPQIIDNQPTIDPETLPIVRKLRERLAKVTAERDRAIEDMNIGKCCGNCAYCGDDDFELPFVNCLCSFECRNLSRWEWRGI